MAMMQERISRLEKMLYLGEVSGAAVPVRITRLEEQVLGEANPYHPGGVPERLQRLEEACFGKVAPRELELAEHLETSLGKLRFVPGHWQVQAVQGWVAFEPPTDESWMPGSSFQYAFKQFRYTVTFDHENPRRGQQVNDATGTSRQLQFVPSRAKCTFWFLDGGRDWSWLRSTSPRLESQDLQFTVFGDRFSLQCGASGSVISIERTRETCQVVAIDVAGDDGDTAFRLVVAEPPSFPQSPHSNELEPSPRKFR